MEADFYGSLIEEVALEGLDGITIESLWVRLKERPNFSIGLDDQSKAFLWKCLAQEPEFQFYELPEERSTVVVFNRFHYVDPDSGQLIDVEEKNEVIYPVKLIKEKGILGSCTTYETQKNVTLEIRDSNGKIKCSLQEAVQRWGNKLAIVASQRKRMEALTGPDFDPSFDWVPEVYCILERIGRSRYHGELSTCLGVFKMDSKMMFYRTLLLVKAGLVKKQSITVVDSNRVKQQFRRIFHLTRFFKEIRCKYTILFRQVCDYLANKPNRKEEYSKTRTDNNIDEKSMKKLLKQKNALNCFKVYMVPYRDFYPDAKESEYMWKSNIKEKSVRVLEIVKMPSVEDEEDKVGGMEEEEEEDALNKEEDLPSYTVIYEKPMLQQALKALELAGPDGTTMPKLSKIMNITYLESRLLLKHLTNAKLVERILVDLGKQKVYFFVAKHLFSQSKYHKEFKEHKEKLTDLMEIEKDHKENESWGKVCDLELKTEAATPVLETKESEGAPSTSTLGTVTFVEAKAKTRAEKKKEQSRVKRRFIRAEKQKKIQNLDPTAVTGKHMKRMSMVLEAIKKNRLFDNTFTLAKLLREKEKEEGAKVMMDKKTLIKIINILVKEKKIRSIKTIITVGDEQKTLDLICDRSVEPTDPLIKSTIEQAKLKMCAYTKDSLKSMKKEPEVKSPVKVERIPADIPESARESIRKLQEFKSKLKPKDMVFEANACFEYGFKPKMQRLKIAHSYIWYLVYGNHPKEPIDCPKREDMASSVFGPITEPAVYQDVTNWTRYLPPLPRHKGYPEGWFLLSDVLLYLPLSLFCSLVRITYRIEGLSELLRDPYLCLFPVCFLPFKITQQLMFARKYIYSVAECCQRLCTMGLMSYGFHIIKEKDQVFIYLHKIGSLVDTRLSEPGYCKVRMPKDHEPEVVTYKFDSQEVVDKYWTDLQYFAFNSNMGHKSEIDDKEGPDDVLLSFEKAVEPKKVNSVLDDGMIPGDRRGPGGLDSSMYVHLVRNWIWSSGMMGKTSGINESEDMFDLPKQKSLSTLFQPMLKVGHHKRLPRTLPQDRLTLMGEKSGKPELIKVSMTKNTAGNKGGKGIKRKPKTDVSRPRKPKKRKLIRKKVPIKPHVPSIRRRETYDESDRKALLHKVNQRVTWTSIEDSILLTCKIAQLIMNKSARGMSVPWTVVRDILYQHAPEESRDKTSHACQRRVTFSLKNSVTRSNLSMFLSEAMQDQEIVKNFANKKYKYDSEFTVDKFMKLSNILLKKFSLTGTKKCVSLPNRLDEIPQYTITAFNQMASRDFNEVTDKASVIEGVLHNIFHSYVSLADKMGRAYEMFKLLNQYPDVLLSSVIKKMKQASLIVKIKKEKERAPVESGIHNVKLSQKYYYKFKLRYPNTVFRESAECMSKLLGSLGNGSESSMVPFQEVPGGGFCAAFIALNFKRKLAINTILPNDIIILDPTVKFIGRGDPTVKSFREMIAKNDDDDDDDDIEMETSQQMSEVGGTVKEEGYKKQQQANVPVGESSKYLQITQKRNPYDPHADDHSYGQQSSQDWTHTSSKRSTFEFESNRPAKDLKMIKATFASRAMITMRRQQQQEQFLKHYNIQDNFVINACCIKMAVLGSEDTESSRQRPGTGSDGVVGMETESHGAQQSEDGVSGITVNKELNKSVYNKMQRTLPFSVNMDEIWQTFSSADQEIGKKIYTCIEKCREIGITYFDLKGGFKSTPRFQEVLQQLEASFAERFLSQMLEQ